MRQALGWLKCPYSLALNRDRCRTTNNLLGDCYGAAVVEALSKDDLAKMDEEKESEARGSENRDLEAAKAILADNWDKVTKVTEKQMLWKTK